MDIFPALIFYFFWGVVATVPNHSAMQVGADVYSAYHVEYNHVEYNHHDISTYDVAEYREHFSSLFFEWYPAGNEDGERIEQRYMKIGVLINRFEDSDIPGDYNHIAPYIGFNALGSDKWYAGLQVGFGYKSGGYLPTRTVKILFSRKIDRHRIGVSWGANIIDVMYPDESEMTANSILSLTYTVEL